MLSRLFLALLLSLPALAGCQTIVVDFYENPEPCPGEGSVWLNLDVPQQNEGGIEDVLDKVSIPLCLRDAFMMGDSLDHISTVVYAHYAIPANMSESFTMELKGLNGAYLHSNTHGFILTTWTYPEPGIEDKDTIHIEPDNGRVIPLGVPINTEPIPSSEWTPPDY